MAYIVTVTGLLVTLPGLLGSFAPAALIRILEYLQIEKRRNIAAGMRLVLGVLFLLAAPACRLPVFVQAVGVIAIVAGVALLLMGNERFERFLRWWITRPLGFTRVWCVFAILFGLLLVYSGG